MDWTLREEARARLREAHACSIAAEAHARRLITLKAEDERLIELSRAMIARSRALLLDEF